MWSYYGSKSKIVKSYPPPKHGKIIEPFAGSARYALKYFDRDILLVDKYEVIVELWKWLQSATEKDILTLPEPKQGEDIRQYKLEGGQLLLMRWLVYNGCSMMGWKVSKRAKIHADKKRIANNLFKIKHWKIVHGDYTNINNETATWFIDPPYQRGGHKYVESNKNIDYEQLNKWCKSRAGHVIVCENSAADWMEFKPMKKMMGNYYETNEVIWSNHPTAFDNEQMSLFNPQSSL